MSVSRVCALVLFWRRCACDVGSNMYVCEMVCCLVNGMTIHSHIISGTSSLTASTNSSNPPTDVGPLIPFGGSAHRGNGLT